MKLAGDTQRKVNIPLDPWQGKVASLPPPVRRLHVTAWVICDDTGRVSRELSSLAMDRWGALAESTARLALSDILEDLERLGFITSVQRKTDCYTVRRSAVWLGPSAGEG